MARRTLRCSFLPRSFVARDFLVLRLALWVEESPAAFHFRDCWSQIDFFNGRGDEYVFDTDVHSGSWQGSGMLILSPSKGADSVGFRSRGIVLQADPSPRSRLGNFHGPASPRENPFGQ